jgi:hypothetical protein
MTSRRLQILMRVLTLTLVLSVVSFADVISFGIGGSSATVSSSGITFVCTTGLTPSCPAGEGNFIVTSISPGSDPAVTPALLTGGSVMPLTEATAPVGETFPAISGWLTVGDVSLQLDSSDVGTFAGMPTNNCSPVAFAGQTCTPSSPALISPGNPVGYDNFALTNGSPLGSGFTADFKVDVSAVVAGVDYHGFATFSEPVTNFADFQDALASLPQTFSYSASITLTSIPEPGFLPLFGALGLLVAGVGLYRKVRFQE